MRKRRPKPLPLQHPRCWMSSRRRSHLPPTQNFDSPVTSLAICYFPLRTDLSPLSLQPLRKKSGTHSLDTKARYVLRTCRPPFIEEMMSTPTVDERRTSQHKTSPGASDVVDPNTTVSDTSRSRVVTGSWITFSRASTVSQNPTSVDRWPVITSSTQTEFISQSLLQRDGRHEVPPKVRTICRNKLLPEWRSTTWWPSSPHMMRSFISSLSAESSVKGLISSNARKKPTRQTHPYPRFYASRSSLRGLSPNACRWTAPSSTPRA